MTSPAAICRALLGCVAAVLVGFSAARVSRPRSIYPEAQLAEIFRGKKTLRELLVSETAVRQMKEQNAVMDKKLKSVSEKYTAAKGTRDEVRRSAAPPWPLVRGAGSKIPVDCRCVCDDSRQHMRVVAVPRCVGHVEFTRWRRSTSCRSENGRQRRTLPPMSCRSCRSCERRPAARRPAWRSWSVPASPLMLRDRRVRLPVCSHATGGA